jgi:hypothetical protein
VLVAPERDHGAEHGEPEKQDRGELVGPGERAVKDIARHHADKKSTAISTATRIAGGTSVTVASIQSSHDARTGRSAPKPVPANSCSII